jgi:hypothetical protein
MTDPKTSRPSPWAVALLVFSTAFAAVSVAGLAMTSAIPV